MPDLDRTLWTGRDDSAEAADARRWHQVVTGWRPGCPPGIALLGFACDEGVRRNQGRPGAAAGPDALRRALANLPYSRDLPIHDAGTVACRDGSLEEAQDAFAGRAAALRQDGQFVIGLGGGHEIAYAGIAGLVRSLPPDRRPTVGVVNLDAHFDLRGGDRASSGTPFRQAAALCRAHGLEFRYCCFGVSEAANTPALFREAAALGTLWRRDDQLTLIDLPEARDALRGFLAGVDIAYLTICLDVLPGAVAPGVSAPAARGVSLEVVEPLIDTALAGGSVALADIAELNPGFDPNGMTARVAARLVHRIAGALPMARPASLPSCSG